ncbi:unnamed protein product [Victoria cruziana]
MSSDENADFSESELEDQVKKLYEQLKGGLFQHNADGTFRCPFCLGKKKRAYRYKEILQHASGVAKSPKDLEKAAKHRALEMILLEDAEQLKPSGSSIINCRPSKRVRLEYKEEKFVWPWMAIVANIPTTLEDGAYVTNGKLKAQFAEFTPAKVTLMWDAQGFRGMAVVEFEKSWIGFYCAISFEKSFEVSHHSKIEWSESGKCDSNMYAWLAREDDYHNSDDYVKLQLHRGDLKTIYELQEEEERKKNTLVDDLAFRIDEKNKDLQSSGEQLMEMTYSRNQIRSALEQKDSEMARLIEEVKKAENRNFDLQNLVREEREKWCKELALERSKLAQRDIELQEREAQNDYEKKKLEEEKKKNAARDAALQMASIEQKKAEESFVKLMECHKREKDAELKKFCDMENRLQTKQTLELEIEKLRGNLQVMKVMEGDDNIDEKIRSLGEELEEKQDRLELLENMNQALIIQQRNANDELQDARKEAISGFKILFRNRTDIGIKRMGELDKKPFREACTKELSSHNISVEDCELRASELASLWEEYMRDSEWHPFKVIRDGPNEKGVIDENDEKLRRLRIEWGEGPYEAVTAAMDELNEYNPSGRYIVEEMWNHRQNRKATLKEVIAYLVKTCRTRKPRI